MLLRRLELFYFKKKLPIPKGVKVPDCPSCFAKMVLAWAQAHQLDCIVTPRLPVGPQRQAVHRARSGSLARLLGESARRYRGQSPGARL